MGKAHFLRPFSGNGPERTNMNDDQLLFYLKANCYGRKRQKSGSYLRQIAGLSESELRRRITKMRRKGIPIASSRAGYFYAETAGEVYAIKGLMRKRNSCSFWMASIILLRRIPTY